MKLLSGFLILCLVVLLGPRVVPLLLAGMIMVGLLMALLQQVQTD